MSYRPPLKIDLGRVIRDQNAALEEDTRRAIEQAFADTSDSLEVRREGDNAYYAGRSWL